LLLFLILLLQLLHLQLLFFRRFFQLGLELVIVRANTFFSLVRLLLVLLELLQLCF